MTTLAAGTIAVAGMAGLALAMPRHFAQVWRREPAAAHSHSLRVIGWLALLGSAAMCVRANGVGVGLVMFCAVLSVGGLLVAWLLPYRPRWLPWLGAAACLLTGPLMLR